jgi:hypothetical protein
MNPIHPSTSFPSMISFHILPSTTRSPTGPLPLRCQTIILYYIFHLSHSCNIFRPARHPWFYHPKSIRRITVTKFFVVYFSPTLTLLVLVSSIGVLSTVFSNSVNLCSSFYSEPWKERRSSHQHETADKFDFISCQWSVVTFLLSEVS